MKIEDLKVGELYYTSILGVIVITDLNSEENGSEHYSGKRVASCLKLRGSREHPLYSKSVESEYFRLASSEDIEEGLLDMFTDFNVGNYSLSISESDIYLTGEDQQVCLKPNEVRELMQILSKEVSI